MPDRSDAPAEPAREPIPGTGTPGPGSGRTLDLARERGGLAIVGASILALFVVIFAVTTTLSQFVFVAVVIVLAAFVAIGFAAAKLLGTQRERIARRYRAIRERSADLAATNGWRYSPVGEVPTTLLGPVFSASFSSITQFGTRMGLTAESATEVVDGEYRGRPFAALHLDGYVATGNGGIKRGNDRSENLVLVRLPGTLPEFRLVNAAASNRWDYGTPLPEAATIPIGPGAQPQNGTTPTLQTRWRLQTANPAFAADLLHPEFVALLGSIGPLDCSIACTNGYLVAFRDPEASPESILARLDLLSTVADAIPPVCWQRAG